MDQVDEKQLVGLAQPVQLIARPKRDIHETLFRKKDVKSLMSKIESNDESCVVLKIKEQVSTISTNPKDF